MHNASMKLSVVIPVFNEASTIATIVEAVRSSEFEDIEIIIVDDCSTDGTVDVLRSDIEPNVDKVLYHDVNRGKGAALRSGFAVVTGDVIVIQDVLNLDGAIECDVGVALAHLSNDP